MVLQETREDHGIVRHALPVKAFLTYPPPQKRLLIYLPIHPFIYLPPSFLFFPLNHLPIPCASTPSSPFNLSLCLLSPARLPLPSFWVCSGTPLIQRPSGNSYPRSVGFNQTPLACRHILSSKGDKRKSGYGKSQPPPSPPPLQLP